MNDFVNLIVNGATEFTPTVIVTFFAFAMVLDFMATIFEILIKGAKG